MRGSLSKLRAKRVRGRKWKERRARKAEMLPIAGDVAAQKERSCEDRLGHRELRPGLRV